MPFEGHDQNASPGIPISVAFIRYGFPNATENGRVIITLKVRRVVGEMRREDERIKRNKQKRFNNLTDLWESNPGA